MAALTAFTPDLAGALAGPDWLRATRTAAAERFATTPLPDESLEVWRYSRIDSLDLDRFAALPGPGAAAAAVPGADGLDAAAVVVTVDGHLASVIGADGLAARGVTIGPLAEHPDGEALLGGVAGPPTGAFGELNLAFAPAPIVIDVPAGVVVPEPIVVIHHVQAAGALVCPRLVVRVGRDAEARVLERLTSDDVATLVVPVTELDVTEAGRLGYVSVQELGPRVWQLAHQASRVARDATLRWSAVGLGGEYARIRTDSRLVGQGASSELLAVYFGERDQMHDFRTLQEHDAPSTTSELLFKGAVEDRARGVYSGLIRITKDGQKANAFQTNRNLVLSAGAHADSVPNLEIEADDVRCSHATAVGPIDDEQRYYVESRGVPPEAAERLIVLGFFGEVLARLAVPEVAPGLRAAVADKLQRREAV